MQSGGKQRHIRTKMVLPVRLSLKSAKDHSREAIFAHTVDISPVGARLGGLRISLQPGEVITLQHRHSKAQFRVIWTKQVGPDELRAGVESVASENNFWGLELSTTAQMGDHSN